MKKFTTILAAALIMVFMTGFDQLSDSGGGGGGSPVEGGIGGSGLTEGFMPIYDAGINKFIDSPLRLDGEALISSNHLTVPPKSISVGNATISDSLGIIAVTDEVTGVRSIVVANAISQDFVLPIKAGIPYLLEAQVTVTPQADDTETSPGITSTDWFQTFVGNKGLNSVVIRGASATTGMRMVIRADGPSGDILYENVDAIREAKGEGFTLAATGDTTIVIDTPMGIKDNNRLHFTFSSSNTFNLKGDTLAFDGEASEFVPYYQLNKQEGGVRFAVAGGGFDVASTGTVSVGALGTAVTGVGTLFTTEFAINDVVAIRNEIRQIATIPGDLSMTLTIPHIAGASGVQVFKESQLLELTNTLGQIKMSMLPNGDTSFVGDIAVNGDDITSDGALTVTPAAGNSLNVALSGVGDFIVNTDDLVVDTSAGNVTMAGDLAINGGDLTSTGALTTTPGAGTNFNVATSGAGNFVVNTNDLIVTASTSSISTAGDLAVNGGDITSTGALTTTPGAGTNFNVALSTTGDFVVNTDDLVVDTSAGNVTMAGDLAVNGDDITSDGPLNLTPSAASSLNVSLSTTGDFIVNTDDLIVDTSAGNVGINTTTPDVKLHAVDSEVIAAPAFNVNTLAAFQNSAITTSAARIAIVGGNAGSSAVDFGDANDADAGGVLYVHSSNSMSFKTAGTALQMVLDSSGNLLTIGSTETDSVVMPEAADHPITPVAAKGQVWVKNTVPAALFYTDDAGTDFDLTATGGGTLDEAYDSGGAGVGRTITADTGSVQIQNGGSADLELFSASATAATTGVLDFRRSRGSNAAPSLIGAPDHLGAINFRGYDGSDFELGAQILAITDSPVGANDMPTRLAFYTTPDGSAAPVEHMRITDEGRIGIGGITPSGSSVLHVTDNADGTAALTIFQNTAAAQAADLSESVELSFGFGSDPFAAFIAVGKEEDYTTGLNESSYISFHNENNGGGFERMRITANGNIGIGTSTPGFDLDVIGTSSVANFGTGAFPFFRSRTARGTELSPTANVDGDGLLVMLIEGHDGTSFVNAAVISAAIDGTVGTGDLPAALVFSTNSGAGTTTEKMRITATGQVGIGTLTPDFALEVIEAMGVSRYGNLNSPSYNLRHARGTEGAPTVVADSNLIGTLRIDGYDGGAFRPGATISAEINGTPSSGVLPTDLVFSTNLGNAFATEMMRLTAGGAIHTGPNASSIAEGSGIGYRRDSTATIEAPASTLEPYDLVLENGSTGDVFLSWLLTGTRRWYAGIDNSASDAWKLANSSTVPSLVTDTVMTVEVAGNVGFGTQTPDFNLEITRDAQTSVGQTSYFASNLGPNYFLRHARGTEAVPAALIDNDSVGTYSFTGYDGAGMRNIGGIQMRMAGVTGVLDMPTEMLFFTTADGASTRTERMALGSSGGIVLTTPGNDFVTMGTDPIQSSIELSGGDAPFIDFLNNDGTDFDMRLQLTSDGMMSLSSGGLDIEGTLQIAMAPSVGAIAVCASTAGTNASIGACTSSERFKNQIRPVDDAESEAIYDIDVVGFEFNGIPGVQRYGVIAEQVDKILPELTFRNEEGQIQGVSNRDMTALMLAELQKLRNRVEELEEMAISCE